MEEGEDTILQLEPALVMVEVESVDGVFGLQAGKLEAAFDGALLSGLQFQIQESFQDLGSAEIPGARISQRLIQMVAHGRQVQVFQFLLQRCHENPFWSEESKSHSQPRTTDRWPAD